ncbi:MAG: hypothetical protein QM737_18800 [Ferruginibacter sp.]
MDPFEFSFTYAQNEYGKHKITTSASYYYPSQLRLLLEIRNSCKIDNDRLSINLLLLISSTTFIESILCENIQNVIEIQKHRENNEITWNMIKSYEDSLLNATFKNYNKIAKDVLGISLNSLTLSDTWESINNLFTLRNQIVHGRDLSYELNYFADNLPVGEFSKNYKQVIDYLVKQNLIASEPSFLNHILTNNVTDFFIEKTKTFFIDISTNIGKKYKIDIRDAFGFLIHILQNK